jgi:uncharacterized protein (TIGR02453 family)
MAKRFATVQLPKSALDFLRDLKRHNDKAWFDAHKNEFLQQQEYVAAFADHLLQLLSMHDVIETPSGRKSLQRIYRDIRFSKDKTPYKTNWAGGFRRATKYKRGGYYFHLEPGNSFIAGGFWGPNADDLRRVREDIAFDAAPLRKIIRNKSFVNSFGSLQGEQLKTVPRGFDAAHEAADLLRYKQFLLIRKFADNEVLDKDFAQEADKTYRHMRPFFDYMSDVLTTGVNGEGL